MNEWQAIESAPKDGTKILVWGTFAGEISGPTDAAGAALASFRNGETDYPGYDWDCDSDYYSLWMKPTHWMPIPPPPEENEYLKECKRAARLEIQCADDHLEFAIRQLDGLMPDAEAKISVIRAETKELRKQLSAENP